MKRLAGICALLLVAATVVAQPEGNQASRVPCTESGASLSHWNGKRVAFLGDSMTQKRDTAIRVYWEYLTDWLGLEPFVYGISGHQWTGIYGQAQKLQQEKGAGVDAILIFAGTNDYNHGVPLGGFFSETTRETNHNGKQVVRKYRSHVETDSTFCGRINKVMAYLKTNFPDQQIIILTPIHRGFAKFRENNVQPEESFANAQGLYLDAYVNALREAASVWAVPLIDLYSLSGLYPMADSHAPYFQHADTDRLHPNTQGNYRLAKTIYYQLQSLPATFVSE
ncbi:SGNH/GDSL hydrolase family protein [Gaoshiqia sediminis]|uniref:SGNH/GDSL hydrolase family protein n=1 Tax=Gaoshiqia sediminis TaxID=2986998 RepID=A0AA41Y6S0_9BACT|nr:SGNH/GDSL hydrolase family protein [Gaoshiqia sediminis]MCW0482979.1 SGNH/GDSL hydrolase family protein [Gaoshiqia sediminis]